MPDIPATPVPQMTPMRAFQNKLRVAFMAIQEAETIALTFPTDVDADATAHITKTLTNAEHELRGAFYAVACLEHSMRGEL